MRVSRTAEMSTASGVTVVPFKLEQGGQTDYQKTKTIYDKFWIECQSCFVFEVDTKFSISIDQLKKVPKYWTIREYEDQRMNETLYYLITCRIHR
jgi:hypothetical protein